MVVVVIESVMMKATDFLDVSGMEKMQEVFEEETRLFKGCIVRVSLKRK